MMQLLALLVMAFGTQRALANTPLNGGGVERSYPPFASELLNHTNDDLEASPSPLEFELSEIQKQNLLDFYVEEDFPSHLSEDLHAEASLAATDMIPLSDIKEIFPKECDILIDKIAATVRSEASEVHLEGARDLRKHCSQWDELPTADKKDFYVALVTSMALAESSCNNKAKNPKAKDGTAFGFWQAPKKLTPIQGARWVMNQLEQQIEQSGLIFWGNKKLNYWAVLNPRIHAYKVKRLLKKIPACAVRAIVN